MWIIRPRVDRAAVARATSQWQLVNRFRTDAAFRRPNRILLDDEKRFTGLPLFFAFRTLLPTGATCRW
jgi:hypothetical protein